MDYAGEVKQHEGVKLTRQAEGGGEGGKEPYGVAV